MFNKYWERTRCECCRGWMEPGFDNRISLANKTYHWDCYWRITWPQKARMARLKKRMKLEVK